MRDNDRFPTNTMQIKRFSLLPVVFAIAAGTLGPTSLSFAAPQRPAKGAAAKRAAPAPGGQDAPLPRSPPGRVSTSLTTA